MKPLKTTIPIRELQTLLRQWRRRGLREAALLKVLELYLGLPDYMNAQGEYPAHFFYELSVTLKFRTVTMMLQAAKASGSFGWVKGDNMLNVSAFYSTLWKEADKKTEDLSDVFPANLQEGSNLSTNHLNPPPEENPLETGRKFFHDIKTNPVEKKEYIEPLIAYFMRQEAGASREEACNDVGYLVNELLIPHFAKQEKFLRMKHNGRLAWLRNLLKSGHGRELMRKAAEAGRELRLKKRQQERHEVMLHNRPLSPYEWTDPGSGKRFYEDAVEGRVTIPAEAPPRPSDEAFWNVIQKSWIE